MALDFDFAPVSAGNHSIVSLMIYFNQQYVERIWKEQKLMLVEPVHEFIYITLILCSMSYGWHGLSSNSGQFILPKTVRL